MTHFTRLLAAAAAAALVALSCSDSDEEHGYYVYVEIVGSEAAFLDRTITANGQVFRPPVPYRSTWTTSRTLCTKSRDLFLNGKLQLRVEDATGVLDERTVDLFACRFSEEEPGYEQDVQLFLEDNGNLAADFGSDARISSSCYPVNHPPLACDHDDFAE